MLSKYFTISAIFVLTFLFFNQEVFACSCGTKPTVLDSFEKSDNVVTARIVSVEKVGEPSSKYDTGHIRSATMLVTKVYKGNIKPGESIKFAQGGGGDCIWTFNENDLDLEFLFYVGKPTKGHPFTNDERNSDKEEMYRAITCGRSNILSRAKDDISYLNTLEKSKGKSRLSGVFGSWFEDDFPHQGIEILVKANNKVFKAKTDKDGFFEIYDIPEGDHLATINFPFGWKLNTYMLERTSRGFLDYDPEGQLRAKNEIPIRIKNGRHTALDLLFEIDTAIKGRVLSPAGKPMKRVCVTAVSTDLKQGDYRGPSSCTDENGQFSIEQMSHGNYILVVNNDGKLDVDEPFGRLFYPGVAEIEKAAIISVERGKHVTQIDIQISQFVELLTFTGRLLYSDGKAVEDERVKFIPDDKEAFDEMSQTTDKDGNFVFRIPKGASGIISSELSVYQNEYVDCSKLEAMFKEAGKTLIYVKSASIIFNGQESPQNNELFLPIPLCLKASEK